MRKVAFTLALALVLLVAAFEGLGCLNFVSANPDGSFPNLAMPVEYVNYTILPINGTLWAQIDGDYPIYVQNQSDCIFNGVLPMVYPMPANATDIHVYLGNTELSWINYTADYPDAVHHTVLGDWWMIYSVVGPVQNFFVLRIHYEHPIQIVNGSYLFLYNLNISPYLSQQNNNSTCYYTITMKTDFTNLHAYTTGSDPIWNPINYTITKESPTQVVSIQENSDFSDNPLPGDMAVTFSSANQVPEIPIWATAALAIGLSLMALSFARRKTISIKKKNNYRAISCS
jgi:TRAP-type C4-dicarboxylate transport system permease small subunit